MSVSCTIKGQGNRSVTITVHGFERPSADNNADANWLNCDIELNVGSFKGHYNASMETTDFVDFRDALRLALEKPCRTTIEFRTIEEGLLLSITFDALGNVIVKGTAWDMDTVDTKLYFAFDSDQSYLQPLLADLQKISTAFPKREWNGSSGGLSS